MLVNTRFRCNGKRIRREEDSPIYEYWDGGHWVRTPLPPAELAYSCGSVVTDESGRDLRYPPMNAQAILDKRLAHEALLKQSGGE